MSEIGWYKSELKVRRAKGSPSLQVFQKALEMVVDEHGGKLATEVSDYYGNKTKCEFAIVLPEFLRGIGIQIERDGSVNFVYDPYGEYERIVQDIVNEITQCYTSIGLIRAMKSLGYRVTDESKKEEKTVRLIGRF